ncbi:pyrroline-5-carboxylate reductase [Spongiibacter nanhainus]|uniref:Pyrroline-5-carboxylate reductase n=1 Tax=Spongiibacter nanhainus TaxID=2794344 RepID=A0A7T4R0Z4_9GAMM|nr:pyrroline-5-carboxylate reductase [Spongiibacter nanhainus]
MISATIGFIGGGNMAASIIGGLLASGVPGNHIRVGEPNAKSRDKLQALGDIQVGADNDAVISQSDIVVLAVKPQVMRSVLESLATPLRERRPLLISIAAGVTTGAMNDWLGDNLAIVRCMPNTPALLQSGATGLFANAAVSDTQRQQAGAILEAVGLAVWVEKEVQLDAVTAVSGSGPAYFFLMMEAMQASGEKLGLDADTARQLTLQTALGAARMALEGDVDVAELRRRVTSPNGTTERAIGLFEQGGLRQLVEQALTGARDRADELAKELEGE